MAENDFQVEANNVSFDEDRLKFCQQIYSEAKKRHDELNDTNIENRLFYEGQDRVLDERGASTKVKRSNLFVHQLTPAIDTRVGDIISKVEEREFPVPFRPKEENPTSESRDNALWIERTINRQMRECGYLTDIFREPALHRNTFSLVLLLWSLAIMPSLCLGGFLEHPCELPCNSEHHSEGHEQQEACHHSADCEADPCSYVTVRNNETDTAWFIIVQFSALCDFADNIDITDQFHRVIRPDLRFYMDNLPFPQADRPLLI